MLVVGVERVLLLAGELLQGALARVVDDDGVEVLLIAWLVVLHKVVAVALSCGWAERDMDVLADEVDQGTHGGAVYWGGRVGKAWRRRGSQRVRECARVRK